MHFVTGGFRHDQRRVLSNPGMEADQHEEGRGSVLTRRRARNTSLGP